MAVDALFQRGQLHQRVHAKLLRLGDFAFDADGPGTGLEFLARRGYCVLVGAEFVVVVVIGDVLKGVCFSRGGIGALRQRAELASSALRRIAAPAICGSGSRRMRRCQWRQRRRPGIAAVQYSFSGVTSE